MGGLPLPEAGDASFSQPYELTRSRAVELATKVLAQLEGQAIHSANQFTEAVLYANDLVPTLCGCLARVGLVDDAKQITIDYHELFDGMFDHMLTDLAVEASAEKIAKWRIEFGDFPSPPETDEERLAHEDHRQGLVGKAHMLCQRIRSLKQLLIDKATESLPTAQMAESDPHKIESLKKRVDSIDRRTVKQKSPREKLRAQRNKFSKPRRARNKRWSEIYYEYRTKYPGDKKASADTLRLSFERNKSRT